MLVLWYCYFFFTSTEEYLGRLSEKKHVRAMGR